MSRRKSQQTITPRMGHDEAVQYLVEYTFGRLSPTMNAAVEAHVRECRICQRQGLSHAATEKREIARQIKRIRPGKRRISRRGRNFIVVLAIVAIAQLGVYQLTRSANLSLGALLGRSGGGATHQGAVVSPTPSEALAAQTTFDTTSQGVAALSISPDGKVVAGSIAQGTKFAVVLWSANSGKPETTLSWPGPATPGALAWSPDGTKIAATDGTMIGVWVLPATAPAWTVPAPTAPALRSYDAQSGTVVQSPNATSAFSSGTFLLWGANGQVTTAPVGAAGPSGVVTPGTPLVGLWLSTGTHLFADGHGGAAVGISAADVAGHVALLSWSPDSRYVLWGAVSQPLAHPGATDGVSAPNPVVGRVVAALEGSASGDALEWYSPDGRMLAQCVTGAAAGALTLYDIATGVELANLPGACAHLTVSSLAWTGSGATFALAAPGQPIVIYAPRVTAP